jgi:putative DNA primase/helicase
VKSSNSQRPKERPTDPHKHARYFLKTHGLDNLRRRTLRYWRAEFWRWTEGRYQLLTKEQLRCELIVALKNFIDTHHIVVGKDDHAVSVTGALVNNTMAAVAAEVMVPDSIEQPSWLVSGRDSHEMLAATNGLISLSGNEAGTLQPHSPEWFSSVCVPYDYDPHATCPTWQRFLNEVLENDSERIAILQEWFGYALTPDTSLHKFVVMEGEGANGKSVVLDVLEAMLGQENVSHVPLEVFGERFQLTMTLNKLANIAPEVDEHAKPNEGVLKQFVAGDRMYFDRKGIGGVDAKPTARLMLATNSRPAFDDRSWGLWRRMIYLPFRVTIAPDKQNRELGTQLKGELAGILNWALQGRERLYRQRRFTTSAVCEAAVTDYRNESNPTKEFLRESCEFDATKSTRVDALYQAYLYWIKLNGQKALNNAVFGREVKKVYPRVEKKRPTILGKREWVYAGLLAVDDPQMSSTN